MRSILIAILFATACGGDDEAEAYPTYQECFDDHHNNESLGIQESIVVCCLEHPIAGVKPVCGNTTAECATYLGTNLGSASATQADVTAACSTYITQKGM